MLKKVDMFSLATLVGLAASVSSCSQQPTAPSATTPTLPPSPPPAVSFLRTFTGLTINSVEQTSDRGYVVGAGSTIIKLNDQGNVVWQKNYGESFVDVRETPDGGFVGAGLSSSSLLQVMKMDTNGNVEWTRAYSSDSGYVSSMDVTRDGMIVCAGSEPPYNPQILNANPRGWVLALNPIGDTLWNYSSDTSSYSKIIGTNDGSIAFIGYRYSGNRYSIPILFGKLSAAGRIVWSLNRRRRL